MPLLVKLLALGWLSVLRSTLAAPLLLRRLDCALTACPHICSSPVCTPSPTPQHAHLLLRTAGKVQHHALLT